MFCVVSLLQDDTASHQPCVGLQELAQLEYSFLQYNPSLLAAAALVVAEAHTGMPGAAANMEQYLFAVTGYTADSLEVKFQYKAYCVEPFDLFATYLEYQHSVIAFSKVRMLVVKVIRPTTV